MRTYRTHALNIALLVSGFVMGQGSVFLVQTLLAANGELELLSGFGTHYSFAILAIILVDGGTATILARHVAALARPHETDDSTWRVFWETILFRAATTAVIVAAGFIYVFVVAPGAFSAYYILLAMPGLVVWIFNGVGLLDGLGASGASGITGAIAYVGCSVGLLAARHASPETAGAILGASFSVGYLLTVGAQWAVLAWFGQRPALCMPTRSGVARAFRDGAALLFQFLPSQAPFRVQLVLGAVYLGPETTALFLYVRQIIGALAQVTSFVLRAEFPGLVRAVLHEPTGTLRTVLHAQRFTLLCATGLTIGLIGAAGLATLVPHPRFPLIALFLAAFGPTLLTAYLAIVLSQGLAAMGLFAGVAMATTAGAGLGIGVSYLLIGTWGVYAFLAGEITSHAIGCTIAYMALRGRLRPTPTQTPPSAPAIGHGATHASDTGPRHARAEAL